MNELALFTGIGGGLLASKLLGWRTVCYVENNQYCVEVLKARIKDGYLDDAPIWDDVRTFDGRPWRGSVDIITAGFPCQPFSVAGKRKGEADERNLWPDTIRIICEVRPPFVFLENVRGLVTGRHRYFGTILGSLADSGYNVRWRVLSAAEVGAPHKRDRVWFVAYTQGEQNRWLQFKGIQPNLATSGRQNVADAKSEGLQDCVRKREAGQSRPKCGGEEVSWWDFDPADAEDAIESQLGRVAYGIPRRVDRLKAIGNAQVPEVARTAWQLLTQDSLHGIFTF